MYRKLRRETMDGEKRLEKFLKKTKSFWALWRFRPWKSDTVNKEDQKKFQEISPPCEPFHKHFSFMLSSLWYSFWWAVRWSTKKFGPGSEKFRRICTNKQVLLPHNLLRFAKYLNNDPHNLLRNQISKNRNWHYSEVICAKSISE